MNDKGKYLRLLYEASAMQLIGTGYLGKGRGNSTARSKVLGWECLRYV